MMIYCFDKFYDLEYVQYSDLLLFVYNMCF